MPWALLAPFFFLRVSAPLFPPPFIPSLMSYPLAQAIPTSSREVGPLEAMGGLSCSSLSASG